jgi:hypothetical protein
MNASPKVGGARCAINGAVCRGTARAIRTPRPTQLVSICGRCQYGAGQEEWGCGGGEDLEGSGWWRWVTPDTMKKKHGKKSKEPTYELQKSGRKAPWRLKNSAV